MTEPTDETDLSSPETAREEAARRARRAVAKLVAAHSIPPSRFGRKRALRSEGQRELGCAIRQSSKIS